MVALAPELNDLLKIGEEEVGGQQNSFLAAVAEHGTAQAGEKPDVW